MGRLFVCCTADSTSARERSVLEALLDGWREYHIVYHADLGRLLTGLARPLMNRLVHERAIDRFFFVRYTLGGPHLRLRWRVTTKRSMQIAEEALAEMATGFFQTHPSLQSAPREKILRINRTLGPLDPCDDIDAIYDDNTWLQAPMRIDVERYGGTQNIKASLDLFTISTVRAMQVLHQSEAIQPAWIRTASLVTLLQLAFGFARDEIEFLHHIEFAVRWMGDDYPGCSRQADRVFAAKAIALQALVQRELQSLVTFTASRVEGIAAAAACLRGELDDLSTEARYVVACSHLHMTANRFGLSNQEEVYLSRLLCCTIEALRRQQPAAWRRLWLAQKEFLRRADRSSMESLATAAVSQLS